MKNSPGDLNTRLTEAGLSKKTWKQISFSYRFTKETMVHILCPMKSYTQHPKMNEVVQRRQTGIKIIRHAEQCTE